MVGLKRRVRGALALVLTVAALTFQAASAVLHYAPPAGQGSAAAASFCGIPDLQALAELERLLGRAPGKKPSGDSGKQCPICLTVQQSQLLRPQELPWPGPAPALSGPAQFFLRGVPLRAVARSLPPPALAPPTA